MRKTLVVLMISFAFIWCLSVVQSMNAASDPDLVALWTFDEVQDGKVEDSSENGNDGEVRGGVQLVDGELDGALEFDGTGQVFVPKSDSLNDFGSGDFSIVFWVKSSHVIGQFGDQWWNGSWILNKDIGGGVMGDDWIVIVTEGKLVFMTGNAPLVRDDLLISTDLICDGDWHHVGLTREKESGVKTMYIDGVMDVSEVQGPGLTVSNTQDLKIGTPRFEGTVDDIAFYSRVLSQAEILTVMSAGAGVAAMEPMGKLTTTWGMIKN